MDVPEDYNWSSKSCILYLKQGHKEEALKNFKREANEKVGQIFDSYNKNTYEEETSKSGKSSYRVLSARHNTLT